MACFHRFEVENEGGRYWARTSDPQLVEHASALDTMRLTWTRPPTMRSVATDAARVQRCLRSTPCRKPRKGSKLSPGPASTCRSKARTAWRATEWRSSTAPVRRVRKPLRRCHSRLRRLRLQFASTFVPWGPGSGPYRRSRWPRSLDGRAAAEPFKRLVIPAQELRKSFSQTSIVQLKGGNHA
jgi:hypothetical protein